MCEWDWRRVFDLNLQVKKVISHSGLLNTPKTVHPSTPEHLERRSRLFIGVPVPPGGFGTQIT